MDKIKLLQARKQQIADAGKTIRQEINMLIDENSFVEQSVFSFSKNDFYGEVAEGEGVITGFATIDGNPFYIVAQNSEVLSGGISKANCAKIVKCLEQAEKFATPVVYLVSSMGVQVGEGVSVLEGLASVFAKATALKGLVPQYLVVNGEVYGQVALLSAICDYTFFFETKSFLAVNSPLVISAQDGVNVAKQEICSAKALNKTNLTSFVVKDFAEIKSTLAKLSDLILEHVVDSDELNTTIANLNKVANEKNLLNVFDKNSYVEIGATFAEDVKCYLGRVGGITVAAVVFADENGVQLNAQKVKKLTSFAQFANSYELPYVTFVNTLGLYACRENNNSTVLAELAAYMEVLGSMDAAKISVVYGKAIGLGYTVFASKSMGYDYSYAFANAKIALFDSVQGAEVEFANEKNIDMDKLAEKYADENSDPINAAKDGYIDNIIEPAFVKQYLVASLQMLLK